MQALRDLIWSAPLMILLGFTGLYLTFLLRGVQFRFLLHAFKFATQRDPQQSANGELTHFQALMTSLAAAVGTGNIAGVATAITTGGLGSLFWMWVIAIFGMAIKYSEAFLAGIYRKQNSFGEMSGGPMYVLRYGLNSRFLSISFAALGVFATLGTGNMVQVNSVADAMRVISPVTPWMTGVALSVLTACILFGGISSIGKVAEVFVPVMALAYVLGGGWILISSLEQVIDVFRNILIYAFQGQAAQGAFLGTSVSIALQSGVARGIFSNEAGLGTSSIASAAAKSDEPGQQALVSMTSVFIATLIICTMTGLVIGVSDGLGIIDPQTGLMLNGAPLAMYAFESGFKGGGTCVAIGLIFFAYSTILGWAYYGEKCFEFLFGTKWIFIYRILYIAVMIPASIWDLHATWLLADCANGLMAIPNLIGILGMRKVLQRKSHEFCSQI